MSAVAQEQHEAPLQQHEDLVTSTATATLVRPRPRANPPARPQWWNVVLLNDDDHTYEYVIRMLGTLFAHPIEKAFQLAKSVDADGRVICLTTHKEHAELKRDQILAFGRDPLSSNCKGSMSAIIEPAEFDDDSDDKKNNEPPARKD